MKILLTVYFLIFAFHTVFAQSSTTDQNTNSKDSALTISNNDSIVIRNSSNKVESQLINQSKNLNIGNKIKAEPSKSISSTISDKRLERRKGYENRIKDIESNEKEKFNNRYERHLKKLEIADQRQPLNSGSERGKNSINTIKQSKRQYTEKLQKFKKVKFDSATIREKIKSESVQLINKVDEGAKNKIGKNDQLTELKNQSNSTQEGPVDQVINKDNLQGYSKKDYLSKQSRDFTDNKLREKLQKFKDQGSQEDFNDRIKNSQQEISKYKKKYSEVKSLSELKDKPINPLKDQPAIERFIFGTNLQIHSGDPFGVDISPQVSYLVFPKLALGLGATYRVGIDTNSKNFLTRENEVYGGRFFSDFALFKNIYLHAEYETLRKTPIEEHLNYQVDNNLLGGLMMKFRISKNVNGNMQLLYNFLDEDSFWNSPNRLIYRIGFEIKGKKKEAINK